MREHPPRRCSPPRLAAFRPGQREAVEAALAETRCPCGHANGGGKSLCYQLPGLATSDLTIVVSPHRPDGRPVAAQGRAIPAVMIASRPRADANAAALRAIRDGTARVAYCSPERFGSGAFLRARLPPRHPDGDRRGAAALSEWGHDSAPTTCGCRRPSRASADPTVMACTATATKEVASEVISRLQGSPTRSRSARVDRPNLSFDTVQLEGKGSKGRKAAVLVAGLADPANR